MDDLIPEICHEWRVYFSSLPRCSIHTALRSTAPSEVHPLLCCCVTPCEACVFHRPIDYSLLSSRLQYAVRFYPTLCEIAAISLIGDARWKLSIYNLPETIDREFNVTLFNSGTLGQLVSVSGVAVGTSEIVQLLVGMEFKCTKCGNAHFAKMPFPGILSFPSTQEGEFENAGLSVPSAVGEDNAVGKWKTKIESLMGFQNRALRERLSSFRRKALVHFRETHPEAGNLTSLLPEPQCECMRRQAKSQTVQNRGKYIPMLHRALYVDAQIIKVREDRTDEGYLGDPIADASQKPSRDRKRPASSTNHSPATSSTIDVLIFGAHAVVPDLAPGTRVTVTGVLTVASAVVELLKKGGVQKRISQNISKGSAIPDIQHHPGDYAAGPKSVMLLSAHIQSHKETNKGRTIDPITTQNLSPPDVSFFAQCSFQERAVVSPLAGVPENCDLERLLVDSFCPGIIGHHNIKLAILICAIAEDLVTQTTSPKKSEQLFDHSSLRRTSAPRKPSSALHILILGPAGIGKSQLLKFASGTLFRSIYVCGPTLTPTGLGVGWSAHTSTPGGSASSHARLEAGALIVADGGLSCIDEIDKMSLPAQNVLHEVIDQGTLTVSKAAVLHTVTTSTRVIAAGNIENVHQLSPELLSRFSLIFCISPRTETFSQRATQREESSCRSLLMSVLGSKDTSRSVQSGEGDYQRPTKWDDAPHTAHGAQTISVETLRAYLHHLKHKPKPFLTASAKSAMADWYLAERRSAARTTFTQRKLFTHRATPRQMQHLYQMACCLAKIRGKKEIDACDVQSVTELMAEVGNGAARSGTLSSDASRQKPSQNKRQKKSAMVQIFLEAIRTQSGEAGRSAVWSEAGLEEIYSSCFGQDIEAGSQNLTPFQTFLETLNANGSLLKASHSKYRLG